MSWTPAPKLLGCLSDGMPCIVDTTTNTTYTPWSYYAAEASVLQLGSDGVSLFMADGGTLKVIRPTTAPYSTDTIGAFSDYENLCISDGFVYAARPDGYIYRMAEDGSGEVLLGRVFAADHVSQVCNGLHVRGDVLFATWTNTTRGYRVSVSSWSVTTTPETTPNWILASTADFDNGVLWMSCYVFAPQLVAGFSGDAFGGTPIPNSNLELVTFIGDKLYGMAYGLPGHVLRMDVRARNMGQTDLGNLGIRSKSIADASLFQVVVPNASVHPPQGTYQGVQLVVLKSSQSLPIRYTLDGSEPTISSPLYVGPIPVYQDTQVKAVAFYGSIPSDTVAASYTITNGILKRISSYRDRVLPYLLEQYKGDNT